MGKHETYPVFLKELALCLNIQDYLGKPRSVGEKNEHIQIFEILNCLSVYGSVHLAITFITSRCLGLEC